MVAASVDAVVSTVRLELKHFAQLNGANAQTMTRKQHCKHVPHLASQKRINWDGTA